MHFAFISALHFTFNFALHFATFCVVFGVLVELALIYDFAIQVVRNDHRRMSGQASESDNGSSEVFVAWPAERFWSWWA